MVRRQGQRSSARARAAADMRLPAINAFGHFIYLKESLTDSKNQYTSTMWFEDDSELSGAYV